VGLLARNNSNNNTSNNSSNSSSNSGIDCFGDSAALSGCLLPGSGGLPARTHRRGPSMVRCPQHPARTPHRRFIGFAYGNRKIPVVPAGCPDHQANIVERLGGIPGRRWGMTTTRGWLAGSGRGVALAECLLPGSGGQLRGPVRRSAPAVRAGARQCRRPSMACCPQHPARTPHRRFIGVAYGNRKIPVVPVGCPDHQANFVERLGGIPDRHYPCSYKYFALELPAGVARQNQSPTTAFDLPSASEKFRWRLSGVPITKRISWSD
jgi:hypothetical protein